MHSAYFERCYPEEMREIEKILIKYSKVFAWTYEDMPSIDTDITQHYIPPEKGVNQ